MQCSPMVTVARSSKGCLSSHDLCLIWEDKHNGALPVPLSDVSSRIISLGCFLGGHWSGFKFPKVYVWRRRTCQELNLFMNKPRKFHGISSIHWSSHKPLPRFPSGGSIDHHSNIICQTQLLWHIRDNKVIELFYLRCYIFETNKLRDE